jgi:hypothetical protein
MKDSQSVGISSTEIFDRGKNRSVDAIYIDNKEIIVTGKFIRIASIKEEWDEDVDDPVSVVEKLRSSGIRADIFTFMQRLPESRPKFDYQMEWDNVAAIPITSYDHWWSKQITQDARNKVRKSNKNGVVIKIVEFNDEFVRGVTEICNETPIRQGRPFWGYGKDSHYMKKDHGTYLDRSVFIGAYYKDELIGYIKLVFAIKFMRTMQILSKVEHRDKAPMNALMAKAVEICAERGIHYLVYAKYIYGKVGGKTLRDFKHSNGFENIILPRYHVPLSMKGRIALMLKMHHGLVALLPQRLIDILLRLRNMWYAKLSSQK